MAVPAVGAVVDGYRFKGGNPNDQASWEPVAAGGGPVAKPASPLPVGLQKEEDADLLAIGDGSRATAQLATSRQRIEDGYLNLGPIENLSSRLRNMVGMSDQNSRNFASFESTLEAARNASLRLNKGVQTEGDAQRAWNELVTNIRDEKLVAQRLAEIEALNAEAIRQRAIIAQNRRSSRGLEAVDTSSVTTPPPQRPIDALRSPGNMAAGLGVNFNGFRNAGDGARPSGAPRPPPEALAKLREGVNTPFQNGQTWTLRNGRPVRLR